MKQPELVIGTALLRLIRVEQSGTVPGTPAGTVASRPFDHFDSKRWGEVGTRKRANVGKLCGLLVLITSRRPFGCPFLPRGGLKGASDDGRPRDVADEGGGLVRLGLNVDRAVPRAANGNERGAGDEGDNTNHGTDALRRVD